MKKLSLTFVAALLTGCVTAPPSPPRVYVQPAVHMVYQTPAPQPVVSVYIDPPLYQPPPVRVQWAPPPMLVEVLPPRPYADAVWTGGYWVWEGNWIWAHGRWSAPPQPGYGWVNPYYEHRDGAVIFVNGFWAAPGVSFVRPSLSLNIAWGAVSAGVIAGPRPLGPEGTFVPAPPGSRFGLIVPAPIGTAPAVVVSAPPVVNEGMRIHINNNSNNTTVNNTTINNVSNVTNITNVSNVTIIAPASATANGQAVNRSVPAQAHLAAALPAAIKAPAPEPVSSKAIPAYIPGRAPMALPAAQIVHADASAAQMHPHAEQTHPDVPSNVAAQPAHPQVPPATSLSTHPSPVENQPHERFEAKQPSLPNAQIRTPQNRGQQDVGANGRTQPSERKDMRLLSGQPPITGRDASSRQPSAVVVTKGKPPVVAQKKMVKKPAQDMKKNKDQKSRDPKSSSGKKNKDEGKQTDKKAREHE